jgi:hypothetical protein
MRGALLRSGKSESFTALGETGQPVYRAALQLREAIRRKNPGLAEHLAVPQSNENGNQIDWYADFQGDVIPWSAATEQEREPARQQLEQLNLELKKLSAHYLGSDADPHQGDKAVFGKLLKRVVTFPDENFIYLVNGTAVITFWGFLHPDADRNLEPLHCLYPKALQFDLPADEPAPIAPPVAAPLAAHAVQRRPWWRRWWWLLPLLLLLLLLLLFGLRSCVPSLGLGGIPGLPEINVPKLGSVELPVVDTPKIGLPNTPTGSAPGVPAAQLPGGATGGEPVAEAGMPGGETPATPPADAQAETPAPAPAPESEPPANEPELQPPAPPELEAPAQPTPANTNANASAPPLSIPEGSQDGVADFLNGHYRAGAGIQDRRTGKPLRLEYQFKDGKGDVTVSRADGVACTGPVTAAMKGGNLSIDSHGQAACADGSNYDMPKVDCKPGAKSIADCTGGYANEQFPMSMRQTGE